MKKILFVVESLAGGGAEKVLLTLVKNLDKTKYDITVFTVVRTGVYVEEFEKHCKVIFALDDYSKLNRFSKIMFRIKNKLIYTLNSSIIYEFLIKEKYDIEIAFVEGFSTKLVASSRNKFSKKYSWIHTNMITNPHADIHYKNLADQQFYYRKLNHIFAVSKDVMDSFIKKFNVENISIQYNPIDSNEIVLKSKETQNVIDSDNFNFITIGRLEEPKGYIRLLEVANRLYQEGYDFHLYFLGEGSQRDKLEKMINDNKLRKSVNLLGFETNPYKFLKDCDCFVCSSYSEGFSTVATESMILNIPILTTRCSGMEELFGEYNCGIIADNNTECLYDALKMVLDNKNLLIDYREQINIRKKYFDIKTRIKEIEEILDEE